MAQIMMEINAPDFSRHGLKDAFKKTVRVFSWHVGSNIALIGLVMLNDILKNAQVEYPEYALYFTASVGILNSVGVFLKNWLEARKPKTVLVEEVDPVQPVDTLPDPGVG